MSVEKPSSWVFRSTIHWSFRVVMLAVVIGLALFWGIDTFDVHQDLLTTTNNFITKNITNLNLTTKTSPQEPLTNKNQNLSWVSQEPLNKKNLNLSWVSQEPLKKKKNQNLSWVSVELDSNYSTNLFSRWMTPGGEPCKDSTTQDIFINGIDDMTKEHVVIELTSGVIHKYVFQAVDGSGNSRCLGGDYFEIDLSSHNWKSRPPVQDFGNGTYLFSLQVHQDFVGEFNLTIGLLFRHYQGLKFSPERFALDKLLRVVRIRFRNDKKFNVLPEIKQCGKSDYTKDLWAGRWTRHGRYDECRISNDGRYRCLEPDYPCQHPWCHGALGSLESNGWVYSTHCSFKLFDKKSAWKCLNNRWLFFWGDSNHCDTIRNMLNFVLDYEMGVVPRLFDMNITNPKDPKQSFRITNVFNGHYNHTGNYQGLNSLYNDGYREYLRGYFSGEVVPDTLIMNSGLHDGVYWPNLRRFIKGANDAAAFWAEVLDGVRRRNVLVPQVVYRTTVATGGYARRLVFNPSKMEAFNGVFVDKLRQFGVIDYIVDHFDMTYPWHYDNRCNDGVHYGRFPAKARWRDGQIGHQYFVDLMLCHVLLNLYVYNASSLDGRQYGTRIHEIIIIVCTDLTVDLLLYIQWIAVLGSGSGREFEWVLDRFSTCYPVSGDAVFCGPFCVEYKWEKKDSLAGELVGVVGDSWVLKTDSVSITWHSIKAVLAKIDPVWGRKYRPLAYSLMSDFMTLGKDGRNQESTIEAVNVYYSAALMGLAYGDTHLVTIGSLLTAMEIRASQTWNSSVAIVEWTLPAFNREGGVGEGWKGFVYALEGVYDNDASLQKIRSLSGHDDGNSPSNLLWWILSRGDCEDGGGKH
ncbi:putative immunoglobulin-like protein [Tanacetum coccineum]